MVLALKLITAGVSYQDGLKKPEVPRFCLLTAVQQSSAHQVAHAMGVTATCRFLGSCMAAHPVDLSPHLAEELGALQELSPYQQRHRLTKMPSPLEWLSFTFASGNLLAGPYFELSDYLDFINRKGPWDPKSKQPSLASQYGAGVRLFRQPWQQDSALQYSLPPDCWSAYIKHKAHGLERAEAASICRPGSCC